MYSEHMCVNSSNRVRINKKTKKHYNALHPKIIVHTSLSVLHFQYDCDMIKQIRVRIEYIDHDECKSLIKSLLNPTAAVLFCRRTQGPLRCSERWMPRDKLKAVAQIHIHLVFKE